MGPAGSHAVLLGGRPCTGSLAALQQRPALAGWDSNVRMLGWNLEQMIVGTAETGESLKHFLNGDLKIRNVSSWDIFWVMMFSSVATIDTIIINAKWFLLVQFGSSHCFSSISRVYFGFGYVFPIGNSNPKIGNFTLDPWGLPGPWRAPGKRYFWVMMFVDHNYVLKNHHISRCTLAISK